MASHGPTISSGNLMRLAIGGAIGGVITFYLLDPGMREVDSGGMQRDSDALLLGAIIGAAIGTMLILADEIQSPKPMRIIRSLLFGIFVGSLIGTIGVFCADIVFDPLARTGVFVLRVVGRAAGWTIMGAAAGLCPGVVAGSMVRIRQGAYGGCLGGAAGGIVFDVIAGMTGTGSASRFVGFTITGLAIGIAVGLIEELRKVYWLTVLTGGKEGRSYILTRPSTILGRDELVDVPLFGDAAIQKQHASIVISPTGATLVTRQGARALVNGAYMPQIALQDGDVMEFGRHRLRFNQRAETGSAPQMVSSDLGSSVPFANAYIGQPTSLTIPVGGAVTSLTAVEGPHAGAVFVLTNGAILGRDERCDVALIGDPHLSRQHARFVMEGANWIVQDGNSANGLYVNGVRVARHVLAPGDQIAAGQTVIQVS